MGTDNSKRLWPPINKWELQCSKWRERASLLSEAWLIHSLSQLPEKQQLSGRKCVYWGSQFWGEGDEDLSLLGSFHMQTTARTPYKRVETWPWHPTLLGLVSMLGKVKRVRGEKMLRLTRRSCGSTGKEGPSQRSVEWVHMKALLSLLLPALGSQLVSFHFSYLFFFFVQHSGCVRVWCLSFEIKPDVFCAVYFLNYCWHSDLYFLAILFCHF